MRFMALAWDAGREDQSKIAHLIEQQRCATSPQWRCIVSSEGFKVFCCSSLPTFSAIPIGERQGVVFGTLFGSKTDNTFNSTETSSILDSKGRWLVRKCWGRYVCFLHDYESGAGLIFRDPTGGIRCLHTKLAGVQVFFSCMLDCIELGMFRFSINWQYIAESLITPAISTKQTALEGVVDVLAGECVAIQRGGVSTSWYWHPSTIANTNVIEDADTAAAAFQESIIEAVNAWASRHRHIVLGLSGGLDSSGMAAFLSRAPSRPRVTAIHHYYPNSADADKRYYTDADERYYARLAAQHAGCELIEEDVTEHYRILSPSLTDRPGIYVSSRASMIETAKRIGATGLFNGNGGDQLFMQNYGARAAIDFLACHGMKLKLLRVTHQTALLDNSLFWSVLGMAIRSKLWNLPFDPRKSLLRDPPLVHPEVLTAIRNQPPSLHEWLLSTEKLPPGKRQHVYELSFPINVDVPTRDPQDAEPVSPYYSQHVIEDALRTRTHAFFEGGWSRMPLRKIIDGMMPKQIVYRYTKGGVEAPQGQLLMDNLPLIQQRLLDGELMRRRLLHRQNTEKALTGKPSDLDVSNGAIFAAYSMELWAGLWLSSTAFASN